MPTDIPRLFSSLGLSESETKIYLASLSLGPSSVQNIAKRAVLSRTAAYDAVESLKKRGLMSTSERGSKNLFTAEDPERAVGYFQEKAHSMEEQLETLRRALPEVKLLAGGERPTARFYEGREAIYALFSDVERLSPKILREMSNLDDVNKIADLDVIEEMRKRYGLQIHLSRVVRRGLRRRLRPDVSGTRGAGNPASFV